MSNELKIRKCVLRCFSNGFNAIRTADLITEKFGVKGYGSRTCQRWFRKFRCGDFNLLEKPTHDNKPRMRPERNAINIERKSKLKITEKDLKMEETTFKEENKPQDIQSRTDSPGTDIVEKIIQRKREITVSRVKQGTIRVKEPSKLMSKRVSIPFNRSPPVSVVRPTSSYKQRKAILPGLEHQRRPLTSNNFTSRSQSRLRGGLKTDLKLPPSIAKRMTSAHVSTENHIIGEGFKGAQKTGEIVKKPITVQFQNLSPEVAKNTVRKSTESGVPLANANKRLSAQTASPLASPKGVIYLNPQEIFGESIGFKNPLKKTIPPVSSLAKPPPSESVKKTPAKPPAPVVTPAPPAITVDDSDSEDDLLFPENVSIPPPKVKAVVNTFTTYWDMETDKPILLNPSNDLVSSLPVIEID